MEILWLQNQIMTLKDKHESEISKLQERIAELEAYVSSLQEANARLYNELDELRNHAPESTGNTQGA